MKRSFRTTYVMATSFVLSLTVNAEPANKIFTITPKAPQPYLAVHKSPTCGCCLGWMEHMQNGGFSTTAHHPERFAQFKLNKGINQRYQSCHTSVSEQGYVFEGHVPVKFVKQFLADTPNQALGLSVPGMPVGSPGMEVGEKFMPYQVLLLKRDGSYEVFAQVRTAADQL